MKAVRFHELGGPEVLRLEEVPVPEPGPGQVRIAVRAAALNHLDLWVRRGLPIRIEMPHVGGSDVAGLVDALGAGVAGWSLGDRVVVHPLLPPARAGGEPRILGEHLNGGFQEALVVDAANLRRVPEALSFEQAAALPVAFVTAWQMLVGRAGLQAGETVLVQGAGSGVGTAAVQIGRLLGARVIAATSSRVKQEGVRALGAHDVIDYREENIYRRVLALTGGRGADVVFEHVGPATFEASVLSAARGGRIVVCGATTGRTARLPLPFLFARELSVLGVTLGPIEVLDRVLAHAADGRLVPVIDRVLALEACREAQEWLEGGRHFGKVVLRVGEG